MAENFHALVEEVGGEQAGRRIMTHGLEDVQSERGQGDAAVSFVLGLILRAVIGVDI